ncbi:unnamed protein product, partial [Soboliphyme baturini]|uniref:Carn_acyltransf domain-containing protein n=1 Tax=Soboliphyme baturini TaxID=241478 RepID=A0A183ISZ5_9BILA
FQRSLPQLPLPKLEKTCKNYLKAVQPILNAEQYRSAQGLIWDFCNGDGRRLHQDLSTWYKYHKHTSYITEPWFDMYLKSRVPLPLNFNPFLVWKLDPDSKYNEQACMAANLVISALRFKRSLEFETLAPQVFYLDEKTRNSPYFQNLIRWTPENVACYVAYLFKAYPLDMSQFPFLFSTTRIPALFKDQLVINRSSRHVAVIRNGNFFSVEVLDKDGFLHPPDLIYICFLNIVQQPLQPAAFPLGILTTLDREQWSLARSQLLAIEDNQSILKELDGALFVVNLDSDSSRDATAIGKNFLHGDGCNRWFDKSIQLIVEPNGLSGINFEHSWGDGMAVLRLLEEVSLDCRRKKWAEPQNTALLKKVDVSQCVRKLEFKLSRGLEELIRKSRESFKKLTERLQLKVLSYDGISRRFLQSKGISPDSLVQLAIQIAFYRIHHEPAATYESCSTAAFKHGRTETVRPATMATKRFVHALINDRLSNADLLPLLLDCSKEHSSLVKQAVTGNGFDRHMFALKALAERQGNRIPAVFMDETYSTANHFRVSTSSLSSENLFLGGFGPVVVDGFGIGYNFRDERLGFVVTCYSDKNNAQEFVNTLHTSLDDLNNILNSIKS